MYLFLWLSIGVLGHSHSSSGWRESVQQRGHVRGGGQTESSALVALGSGALFANLTTNQDLIRIEMLYGETSSVEIERREMMEKKNHQVVIKKELKLYKLHNGTLRAYFAGAKRLWSDVGEWRRLRKEIRPLTWREQRLIEKTPINLARMLPILVNPLPPPFGLVLIGLASAAPRLLLTPEFWTLRQWEKFAKKDSEKYKQKYSKVLAECLSTLALVSRRVVLQQDDYQIEQISDNEQSESGSSWTRTPLKVIVEPFEDGAPLGLDVLSRKHLIILARALPKPLSRFKLFFVRTSKLRAKLAHLAFKYDQLDKLLADEFASSKLDPRDLFQLCAQRGLGTSGDHLRRARRIQAWLDARAALLKAHGQSSLPASFLLHMPALFSALIDHADQQEEYSRRRTSSTHQE